MEERAENYPPKCEKGWNIIADRVSFPTKFPVWKMISWLDSLQASCRQRTLTRQRAAVAIMSATRLQMARRWSATGAVVGSTI